MKVPTYVSEALPTARTAGVPSQLRVSGAQLAVGAQAQRAVAGALDDVADVAFGLYERKVRDQRLIEELEFQIEVDKGLQQITTDSLETARGDRFFDAETQFSNSVSSLSSDLTRRIKDPTRRRMFDLYVQNQALRYKPTVDEQILQSKYDIGTAKFSEKLALLQDAADTAPAELLPEAMMEIDNLYQRGVEFGLMSPKEAAEHATATKRSSAISWSGSQIARVSDLDTASAFLGDSSLYLPDQVTSLMTNDDRLELEKLFRSQLSTVASSVTVGAKGGSTVATKIERGQSTGVAQLDAITGSLTLSERTDLVKSIRSGISNRLDLESKERSANEAVRNNAKSQLTTSFNDALTLGDVAAMDAAIDSMRSVDPLAARTLEGRRDSRGFFPETSDVSAVQSLRIKINRGTASFDDIYRKNAEGELILDDAGNPQYFMSEADFNTFAPQIKNLESAELQSALVYARGYLELPEGVSQLADEDAAFFKESRVFSRVQSGLNEALMAARKDEKPFDAMALVDSLLRKEVEAYEEIERRTAQVSVSRKYSLLVENGVIESGSTYQQGLMTLRQYENNLDRMPVQFRDRARFQGLIADFKKATELQLSAPQ